jgi:hypothetical protein
MILSARLLDSVTVRILVVSPSDDDFIGPCRVQQRERSRAESSRGGRGRLACETSGVAARRLRGASKREAASGPASEARPAAEAAGRAKEQRVRVTSALKNGPRAAASAKPLWDQPARRDQRRKLPDELRNSRSARQARSRTDQEPQEARSSFGTSQRGETSGRSCRTS